MRIVERGKGALRWFGNRVVRSSTVVADTVRAELPGALLATPVIAAKYEPDGSDRPTLLVPPPHAAREAWDEHDLRVPPPKLWACFEGSEVEYLASGCADVAIMREMLRSSGYPLENARRILDFGCGAGRMTRWLADLSDGREIWGADISGRCIAWCSQHLSPPFSFVTTTTFPHLPFPDGSFEVVFAGSVFSNLADLEMAWLLEIRRVLASGGRFYATINDRNSIARIMSLPPGHKLYWFRELLTRAERDSGFVEKSWATFSINPGTQAVHVFHDVDLLPTTWGRIFNVRGVRQDALLFQTGVLLERPAMATSTAGRG